MADEVGWPSHVARRTSHAHVALSTQDVARDADAYRFQPQSFPEARRSSPSPATLK
jgi:hypothetical protein